LPPKKIRAATPEDRSAVLGLDAAAVGVPRPAVLDHLLTVGRAFVLVEDAKAGPLMAARSALSRQRLADRVGLDHRADLFERADPPRERVPVAFDDALELAQQGGGLFVGQVKVHDPHMGSLSFPAESTTARHTTILMRFEPIEPGNHPLAG
jgi:hypothetical protein